MISEKELEPATLRDAPAAIANDMGDPAFGTFQGAIRDPDFAKLTGRFKLSAARRLLKEKRWAFHLVATPELVAGVGVVDLGYTANTFIVAVDLLKRRVLVDKSLMAVPGPLARVNGQPNEGFEARVVSPMGGLSSITRPAGKERYAITVEALNLPLPTRAVSWKGELLAAGGPPPLSVVADVGQDGLLNFTQKWAGLLAFGKLSAGGNRYNLDGGVGGLDYTHGYLARHTAWRWAMALGRLQDGTPVGLNLVEGFNEESPDSNENALWIGNRLVPLARARFRFNKQDALDAWKVSTVDGSVELTFRPLHVHREERDFKLVRAHFTQPYGTFTGRVRIDGAPVEVRLGGVTEDQDMVW